MSRKDYIAIAEAINSVDVSSKYDETIKLNIVQSIAHVLKLDNPMFDYDRFTVACGI